MNIRHKLAALSLTLAILNVSPTTVFAQGSLTPLGAPAPTMRSLDQLEARTPISSTQYEILTPGSYYLTGDLTAKNGNDAITIYASGVTLDLNGFTISSISDPVSGQGIYLKDDLRDITILNGHIQSGVTTNGVGVFSGIGFESGITIGNDTPINMRVVGVSVSGCLLNGINLGSGASTIVEACTVHTVGSYGIVASTVNNCTALVCGDTAIQGDRVSNCTAESIDGRGVQAVNAQNCSGSSNSNFGISAGAAQSCYGQSITEGGILVDSSAQNCYGYSIHEIGLNAGTALNCKGESILSIGLRSTIAQNCIGSSSYGVGLFATAIAQNCTGYSASTGTGLYANSLAIGSIGSSASGTGLIATIANSCIGSSYSGTPTNIDHKYNMP